MANVTQDSNRTGLSYAEEVSLNVLPSVGNGLANGATTPVFYALEPNTYPDFGAKFTNVPRETINASRQRLKGTQTDLESSGGLNQDLTQHNLDGLLPGYFYANYHQKPTTLPQVSAPVVITGVSSTQIQAATGLNVFLPNHIVKTTGFGVVTNNKTAVVTASASGSVNIPGLTVEAAPPATAKVKAVGYAFPSGDVAILLNGNLASMSSTATDFTTLGLNVGEFVFLGGDAANTSFANGNVGFFRLATIAAHLLTFDYSTVMPVADSGAGKTIQMFFGTVLRNELDPNAIIRRSYTLERTLGNDGNGVQAEYITGAIPNQLVVNIPLTNKVTADLSFVGMNYVTRTGLQGLFAGTHLTSLGESAINTSRSITSSRLYVVDSTTSYPAGLFSYASDIKLTIDNKQTPDKAIGKLGPFDASAGDFTVSITSTVYFTTVTAVQAIRNNSSCGLNIVMAQENMGLIFDFPWLTLGNGMNKVVKDKPIDVDLTGDAAMSPTGYTALMCFFDYLPNAAMPQ